MKVMLFFCAWMPFGVHAQNAHWESINQPSFTPTPYIYDIHVMYQDTVDHLLYLGGGGSASAGILVYDGDSLWAQGSYPMSRACAMVRYNDTIYVGGTSLTKRLAKWDGSIWDTTGIEANGPVFSLCVYNGELYVGGMFSSIAGINSNGLAKYDGNSWTDISGFPFGQFIGVWAINEFNSELYVAGSFGDSLGNVMNITRWNGQQWRDVGGGFHGNVAEVWRLEVFNGELYIGGSFTIGGGNVGNYMAKWDGSTLSDVGGGMMGMFNSNGQVNDLAVWNNALYAVGVFEYAGGIFTSYIAKWDGLNWCYLGDSLNVPIQCVATLDSSLYIGGGWWIIGNDTISGFAKWIGGNYTANCGNMTYSEEYIAAIVTLVFPNPATEEVTFQFSDSQESHAIIIYDLLGNEIYREETNDNAISISVSEFAAGLYFYTIIDDQNQTTSGKFVVEH